MTYPAPDPIAPPPPPPLPPAPFRRVWSVLVDVWRYDPSVASAKGWLGLLGIAAGIWAVLIGVGVGIWAVVS